MDSVVASSHLSSFPDHKHQQPPPGSPSTNRPSSVPPSLPSTGTGSFKPPPYSNPPYSRQQTTSSSSDHSADSTNFERMLNPAVFFQNIRASRRQKYFPVLSKSPRPDHMVRMMTLHQAARDGQIDIVQQHLNSFGKDRKKVNRKDQENTTPLHYAVRYGHFKIVKMLVANGANVNVTGECGATPLHYAARYVTKPLKTPLSSPSATPNPSPLTRNKNNRTLRQIIAQRKFSQALSKKEVLQKKKAFQRSFRNFMDLTVGKSPRKDAMPLNRLQRATTIHESLERIENGCLATPSTDHGSRPRSNLELGNIFDSPKLDSPKQPGSLPRQDSFAYDYGHNNMLDPPSQKPIVIIGNVSMEDMDNVQSVDAIILPEVHLSPSLSPSISLPDIAGAVQTQGIEKLMHSQLGDSIECNLNAEALSPNMTPPSAPHSCANSYEKLAKESILLYLLEQKANVNARDLYGCTPLHYAAMRGNESAVLQLFTVKNIDIEAKDRTQMTALHTAASVGSVQVCKLLLERGCDIRCLDEEDMTPLHFAAMEGNLEVLELLFQRAEDTGGYMMLGKMIMDQDRDEQTALHLAVENGHTDIVNLLIHKGANVNFVKTNLITPLHLACRSGQLDIIRILVESEADIEAKNGLQETPLHRAALFNRRDVVDYLLNRNADINCRDKDQETPLMMSVRKNNVETVKLLLERNADVGVADSKDKTCLYVAAEENCVDTFELLIQVPKMKQLIEEFNKNENTPLHIAAMKGHLEIVQILLKYGACIDAKNDQNLTPLHLAAQHGKSRIVEMLLCENYNIVNDEDDASNTPLHLAALEGHVKVVSILLQCGAAVDARNAMLWTPLDCAASRGWTWCAESLLDADSIVDPTDKAKTTPLHLASREGHVEMIKLLLSRQADITRKDHLGRNCLDCAIDNNQRGSAMAILDSENWQSALKNCTVEGNKILTPMRKLIKKLPDVAEKVFDKCIRGNGLPKEHPHYEITCAYEFLEDTFADWGPTHRYHDSNLKQYQQHATLPTDPPRSHPSTTPIARIGDKIGDKLLFPGYAKKQSEIKRNHPLKYMVQSERTKLLSHPLVTYLLRHKWRTFGRWFYYSKLLVYAIHLIFLTAYALTIIADEYKFTYHVDNITQEKVLMCVKKNETETEYKHTPSESTRKFFVDFGKYVVLILAVLSILVEIGKMLTELQNYFHIHCILEILAYIVSIMYVMVSFTWADGTPVELIKHSRCNSVDRNLGAIAVWISWINLVLVLRKFPKIGIYVVMFTDILKTFGQFFVVFMLFITAFGLGFHMLLYHQKPIAYLTPARAILKTTMGMLGEFEYDSIFNEAYYPVSMAWAIYVAYLIINCIILMNLLVGLAVDDIKGVQEQAGLKRLAMQVDLTLDVEKALPLSVQRSYIKMEETILPNEERSWNLGSFWTIKSPVSASSENNKENLDVVKKQQDELRDNMRTLKHKLNQLETQNNRMEAMLTTLLRQSEANTNDNNNLSLSH